MLKSFIAEASKINTAEEGLMRRPIPAADADDQAASFGKENVAYRVSYSWQTRNRSWPTIKERVVVEFARIPR